MVNRILQIMMTVLRDKYCKNNTQKYMTYRKPLGSLHMHIHIKSSWQIRLYISAYGVFTNDMPLKRLIPTPMTQLIYLNSERLVEVSSFIRWFQQVDYTEILQLNVKYDSLMNTPPADGFLLFHLHCFVPLMRGV